jgi:hypothetical protein
MPEPITITAAALVAMYVHGFVQRAGERTFEELNEEAESRLRALYHHVKQKVSGNKYAEAALERVEGRPDDERRQEILAEVIDEAAVDDLTFRRDLTKLVEECEATMGPRVEIRDSGVVVVSGTATQEGRNVAGRDMYLYGDDRESRGSD